MHLFHNIDLNAVFCQQPLPPTVYEFPIIKRLAVQNISIYWLTSLNIDVIGQFTASPLNIYVYIF